MEQAPQAGKEALKNVAIAIEKTLARVTDAAVAAAGVSQSADAVAVRQAVAAAKDAVTHFAGITEFLLHTNTLASDALAAVQLDMGE